MVDFANKSIGGGTLGRGSVQEEMLFLTYPELILSMLFMPDAMQDDEAVVMRGAARMSDYGYDGRMVIPRAQKGRQILGDFVAIDAINFSDNPDRQYSKAAIDRELHKAYVGFNHEGYSDIRTGNWGSGAFRGDKRLKMIIQMMACALVNKRMVYCCFEQIDMAELAYVVDFCHGKSVAVLYDAITSTGTRARFEYLFDGY